MASFELELPTELIEQCQRIYDDTDKIFGGMTKAAAKNVKKNVISNLPKGLRIAKFKKNIKMTKTYKTPSDDGINNKIVISGYFINEKGEKVPAPLVANMFEYGSTKRHGKYLRGATKYPFFRKSFKSDEITKIMMEEQKRLSGGLLDE